MGKPMVILRLCSQCNKEFKLDYKINGAGVAINFVNCPHCTKRNDIWIYFPADDKNSFLFEEGSTQEGVDNAKKN